MNLTFEDVTEKIRAFGTGSTWQLPGDIYRFYLARLTAAPRVRGHSHFTQILTIDSGEPALGPDLVAFVRAHV